MADTAHVSKKADAYPYWVGWLRCDSQYTSSINVNGLMISHNPLNFPAQARIRIYQDSKIACEYFSPEIGYADFLYVQLNEVLKKTTSPELIDALYEVTLFPVEDKDLKSNFYEEVWGSVLSNDLKTSLNFPLLVCMGADPAMVDSTYLYYPGVTVDKNFEPYLLTLNHQETENEYDVTLYNADGSARLTKHFVLPPKSADRIRLTEAFTGLDEFFEKGPGLLTFHYRYKMNSYLQTAHRYKGILTGMDHLGLLFAMKDETGKCLEDDRAQMNVNRRKDPVICYCRVLSLSRIQEMVASGMDLEAIQRSTKAGLICQGCVPDLERATGETAKPRSYYAKRTQN